MVHRSKKSDFFARPLPVAVALDSDWSESQIWLRRMKGQIWGFKVGSILFAQEGPRIIEKIRRQGYRVFLDLKFHDIPNTVAGACRAAFSWGVDVLTVHASGGRAMLEAAAESQTASQKIVAVTVLTSFDRADLNEVGVTSALSTQVERLAAVAMKAKIAGLVSSVQEVRSLRQKFPKSFLVTPGVRLGESHDQKRTGTLQGALQDGSSLVVLGRALTEADDWKAAWQKLTSSLGETSLRKRSA